MKEVIVSKYYDIPAVSILLASDKHPVSQGKEDWEWEKDNFREIQKQFVDGVVAFAINESINLI